MKIQSHLGGTIACLLCANASASLLQSDENSIVVKHAVLDEVVVTARRRTERIEKIPVSVVVIDKEQLSNNDVISLEKLDQLTANLSIDDSAPISGSSNAASIYMRGIGQSDFIFTKDPGVGVFLDGAYVGRSPGGVLDLLDVARVEVLRGPQGATFGKNTIGGVINVVSNEPTDNFSGHAALTLGDDRRRDISAVLNLPITESAASRIAVARRQRDGYAQRILAGDSLGDIDNLSLRARLRWQPTSRWMFDWSTDYYRANESSAPTTLANENPSDIGGPMTLFGGTYNVTVASQGSAAWDARWLTNDVYTTNGTGPNRSDTEVLGASLSTHYTINTDLRLHSISAWRQVDAEFGRDADGSPLVIAHTTNMMRHQQFTQELSLAGEFDRLPMDWRLGAFYLSETGKDQLQVSIIPAAVGLPAGGTYFATLGLSSVPPLSLGGPSAKVDNETISLFGDAEFDVTQNTRLLVGLRYSRDDKNAWIPLLLQPGDLPLIQNPRATETFSDWLTRASITHDVNDNWIVYGSYADGFKSGGFNQRYGAPLAEPTRFEPEKLRSFEIGIKGLLLNRRLRMTGAVFTADYDNVQVVVLDAGIPRTINAAQGRVDGVELDLSLRSAGPWSISASYGYLDARYQRVDRAVIGSFGIPILNPLPGDARFVDSPEHSLATTATYDLVWQNFARLRFSLQASYRSEWANDAVNTPELMQDDVTLWNARVHLSPFASRWGFALFVTNLTDESYITSGVAEKIGFGAVEITAARPRQWGAELSYRF